MPQMTVLHFLSVGSESLSPLGLAQEDRLSDRKGGQLIQSCSLMLVPASQINSLVLRRKAILLAWSYSPQDLAFPKSFTITGLPLHKCMFFSLSLALSPFHMLLVFWGTRSPVWPEWYHLILWVSGSPLPGDLPWFSLPYSVGYSYYIFQMTPPLWQKVKRN